MSLRNQKWIQKFGIAGRDDSDPAARACAPGGRQTAGGVGRRSGGLRQYRGRHPSSGAAGRDTGLAHRSGRSLAARAKTDSGPTVTQDSGGRAGADGIG